MTHIDITAKTESAKCFFVKPIVLIGHHGIQVTKPLLENKQLCAEISDKMLEIYKLINE